MKRSTSWIGLIIISLIVLTACGTTQQTGINQAVEQVSGSAEGTNPEQADDSQVAPNLNSSRETPRAMQLALGILKLADTEQAIPPEQAVELLTLWKALRSLSHSETVAAEELQAVVSQIQDTMTPAQLELIASMDLSFDDIGKIAEDLGLDFSMAGRFGDMTPEMQATMQAMRESGQFPDGGFGGGPGGSGPGDGGPVGGFGGETDLSPEQRATALAERSGSRQAGLGIPVLLLDAIVEYLSGQVG